MLKCYLTFFPEDDNRKGSLSNMFVNATRTRDRPAWQSTVAMHYSLYNDHRHGDDDDDVFVFFKWWWCDWDGDGGYETGSTTFGILEIRITLLFSILYYMRQSITKILILKIFRQK